MGKRGQVWIETIIYTLIALVMIGAVLAFAKPKIEELQDKALIEQSMLMMEQLNSKIKEVSQGAIGNQRVAEINLKKGEITIDGVNNEVYFIIESEYAFSERGTEIEAGNLNITTQKLGELNRVTIELNNVGSYDLLYDGKDESKTLTSGSQILKLIIVNKGDKKIDFILG